MKVIVTGGAGFIGSSFINQLKSKYKDINILCIDKMTYASNKDNIKYEVEFLQKDICNVTPEDLGEYEYLINFAAESHVDNSIKDGKPFIKSNIEGTFNLLECAKQNKSLKKFIQISTDEVYGDMYDYFIQHKYINHAASEDSPINPSSYYSATKASADMLVMSANRTFDVPYLITRTCNNFGEHQHPEKFLPKVYQCIKNNTEIPVYGDGGQSRDWIWVEDNVSILIELMFNEKVINQVVNIGSGITYKNIELIKIISEIINNESKIKFVPDRLGHDRSYKLLCSNLRKIHGLNSIQTLPYNFLHIKDYLKKLYS
jgi:dTDP-glucose 4,6-dehydratase